MVYVVEWFTHQVVALGPFRTMRVRASSYTLMLDAPPKGRNHPAIKKSCSEETRVKISSIPHTGL